VLDKGGLASLNVVCYELAYPSRREVVLSAYVISRASLDEYLLGDVNATVYICPCSVLPQGQQLGIDSYLSDKGFVLQHGSFIVSTCNIPALSQREEEEEF
jgi:hypothetical protein